METAVFSFFLYTVNLVPVIYCFLISKAKIVHQLKFMARFLNKKSERKLNFRFRKEGLLFPIFFKKQNKANLLTFFF